ncbi:hypothetical protein SmJEL517_g05016 [Synchytrium microbalum]|uniref:Mitochondrial fission process protein 1 n=1 Tax=Synchytrium microbalum TaxID=1806994 RepID=A0A507C2H7_9FUNG|nr:uncharacterized protein SmJEL517_g05016 [Synchytrium microbalum]TPX31713.1 hypothetical protein SmJEL517_g05016 [Synchytrium microbalum]
MSAETPTLSEVFDVNDPHDSQTTDTDLRYLAYFARARALLLPLAFRPLVYRSIVNLGYAVSWGYVATDVTLEAIKENKRQGSTNESLARVILSRGVFQSLASMALPAFTIHQTVHIVTNLMKRRPGLSPLMMRLGPTAAGLMVVPALPIMFDHPVEYAVERIFDTVWPSESAHRHASEHETKKEL